jgi:hypothetical protein
VPFLSQIGGSGVVGRLSHYVVRRPKQEHTRLLTFNEDKHSIMVTTFQKLELQKKCLVASSQPPRVSGIVTHVERARASSYESKIIEIINSSPINGRKNTSKLAAPASSSFWGCRLRYGGRRKNYCQSKGPRNTNKNAH